MADEISFGDAEQYRGSGGNSYQLTFKQILLLHINRCVLKGSDEWHGGFWETLRKTEGGITAIEKRWIADSRAQFENSVRMLRVLLLGYYDKDMTKADNEIKEKLKTSDTKEHKTEMSIELFEQLILLVRRLNFLEESAEETVM